MWDVFDLWFCVELGLFLYFFSVCTSSSKSTQFLEWFPQAHFKFVTEAVEQECLKKCLSSAVLELGPVLLRLM